MTSGDLTDCRVNPREGETLALIIDVVKDAWRRAIKDDEQGFVIPRFCHSQICPNLALPLTQKNICLKTLPN